MTYFMWNQVWPITELQIIDCETRKIIVENGAKHPLGSTELLYRPRDTGGRGMKSLEAEYRSPRLRLRCICMQTWIQQWD